MGTSAATERHERFRHLILVIHLALRFLWTALSQRAVRVARRGPSRAGKLGPARAGKLGLAAARKEGGAAALVSQKPLLIFFVFSWAPLTACVHLLAPSSVRPM